MRRELVAILLALTGCSGSAPVTVDAGALADPGQVTAEQPPEPAQALPPSRTIAIPAGPMRAGSLPGTPGRRPSREADELRVELPAFEIDRHPFPNDPLASPQLVTSRAEASSLCASRGARLCTELEWERACEGAEGDRFPGGHTLAVDHCSVDPSACASADGVLAMGIEHPEWIAGEVPPDSVRMGRTAILRGALADASIELHRCASRAFELPTEAPPAAFRCCHGAPTAPAYPPVSMHRDFRDLAIGLEELRAALRTVPELAPHADTFTPYGAEDGDRAIARADLTRTALAGWELSPGPFAWSPSPGEEAWVIAGASGDRAILAVLYPLPDGRYVHATSFVIEPEPDSSGPVPIAIARTPPSRGELQWSTAWGRPGEGGVIRFADDATIRLLAR